ncbi:hypothetical protein ID866_7985 [Astraeus odoratus]|nr:hypothetical protein ID866_7985 [Astraeus odoratus]
MDDSKSTVSGVPSDPSSFGHDSRPQQSGDNIAMLSTSGKPASQGTRRPEETQKTLAQRAATIFQDHLKPDKHIGRPPSLWRSLRSIIMASCEYSGVCRTTGYQTIPGLNLLLVFIPVSWALNFALPDKHTLIFIFSFLAIIPLAKLLAFATDELSLRVGQTLAGLMNATLVCALFAVLEIVALISLDLGVELIVSIIALTKCELSIVQSSLVGSILSNLLLVLGMCFFAGGLRFSEQGFGHAAAQLNSSLLTISVIAVLLPGAFHMALQGSASYDESTIDQKILQTSHGVAVILLFIYCSYLLFQLFSHKSLYNDNAGEESRKYTGENPFKAARRLRLRRRTGQSVLEGSVRVASPVGADEEDHPSPQFSVPPDPENGHVHFSGKEEEEVETPQMTVAVSVGLLVVVTVVVAVTAEFLVDSIDGMTSGGGISKEFVGVILLPIVGNAAEHVTAVTVSVKDKLTLSLGVAIGSSIQIALFVIPFTITLAWILGKPLTLLFDPLESIVLFLSVLTVNYAIQDGKSNWLEGMILMCLYLILGVTFWFYPGISSSTSQNSV